MFTYYSDWCKKILKTSLLRKCYGGVYKMVLKNICYYLIFLLQFQKKKTRQHDYNLSFTCYFGYKRNIIYIIPISDVFLINRNWK